MLGLPDGIPRSNFTGSKESFVAFEQHKMNPGLPAGGSAMLLPGSPQGSLALGAFGFADQTEDLAVTGMPAEGRGLEVAILEGGFLVAFADEGREFAEAEIVCFLAHGVCPWVGGIPHFRSGEGFEFVFLATRNDRHVSDDTFRFPGNAVAYPQFEYVCL